MYQALYRKWRPRSFADVVGQEHITSTLRREVAEGRTSHAYLFTGTRGTGKTTCAKILAKAVNCEHPVNGDPCNCCKSCLGIDNGSFTDVLELDAASNNGVDQVRALRDEAIYSPANVKKRVYIVDEVHMLSAAAFNALLKIMEEPPEHLIFILATTELNKVPATILSRCQRFSFKRITAADIEKRLSYIAKEENFSLTDDAAAMLAGMSDGALRDALSLLDQCAAAAEQVDTERILSVLGLAGRKETEQLMRSLLASDTQSALLQFDRLYTAGKDANAVLGELTTLTRDLIIRTTVPRGGEALYTGGYDDKTLDSLLAGVSQRRLMYMASTLQEFSYNSLRGGNRRLEAELCLLTLAEESLSQDGNALLRRIERLEEQMKNGVRAAEKRTVPSMMPELSAVPAEPEEEERPPLPEAPEAVFIPDVPDAAVTKKPPERPAEPVQAADPVSGDSGDVWKTLLEKYKNRIPPMSRAFLSNCSGSYEGGVLRVLCDTDFTKEMLATDAVRTALSEVTAAHVGTAVRVEFHVGEMKAPAQGSLDDLIDLGKNFGGFTIK